jgi:hypothetical protein
MLPAQLDTQILLLTLPDMVLPAHLTMRTFSKIFKPIEDHFFESTETLGILYEIKFDISKKWKNGKKYGNPWEGGFSSSHSVVSVQTAKKFFLSCAYKWYGKIGFKFFPASPGFKGF